MVHENQCPGTARNPGDLTIVSPSYDSGRTQHDARESLLPVRQDALSAGGEETEGRYDERPLNHLSDEKS